MKKQDFSEKCNDISQKFEEIFCELFKKHISTKLLPIFNFFASFLSV